MMKQKQQGFTIIELLVVIAIMGIIASILIVNYNQQSGVRNLKIAQSQLVTNVRKIQSYILSSRNINTGQINSPPREYMISLQSDGTQYTLQGIDSQTNTISTIETVKLPQGIVINSIQISEPGQQSQSVKVVTVAYASPYGKMYAIGLPSECAATMAYANLDQACLLKLADRQVTITLMDQKSLSTKIVNLYGVSGTVSISQ